MSDELDQDEFERAFEEASTAPKAKSAGRPPAPCGHDVAVYLAVCTAHKRGHPLSPPGDSKTTRRPSNRRRPGAATGKCSAFAVVAEYINGRKTYLGASTSARRPSFATEYGVMKIYYRVAEHRASIEQIMLSDDFLYRFPARSQRLIERYRLRNARAATKQRG